MATNFPSSPLACGSLAHVEVNLSPRQSLVLVAAAGVSGYAEPQASDQTCAR